MCFRPAPSWLDEKNHPALIQAWKTSQARFLVLQEQFSQIQHANIAAITVSGSLGRMEVIPESDVDIIVVVHENHVDHNQQIMNSVRHGIDALGLPLPLCDGIFATPISTQQLSDASDLGRIDEDVAIFGKRIQLLIDSRPMGNWPFSDLIQSVLDRYSVRRHGVQTLLDDLIRYHRSLAIHYRWSYRNRPHLWRSYNVKMFHSRVINFAGLLFLITRLQQEQLSWDQFVSSFRMTPLERIVNSSADMNGHLASVLTSYDNFVRNMPEMTKRTKLEKQQPKEFEFEDLERDDLFHYLQKNGQTMKNSLLELLQRTTDSLEWKAALHF